MLIRRLKPEQKRAAAITTTEAHIVSDNNTEPLYDNSTPTANITTTEDLHTDTSATNQTPGKPTDSTSSQTISAFLFFGLIWLCEFSSRMFGRTLLLVCFAIFFCAGETVAGQVYENVPDIYTVKFRPGEIRPGLMYSPHETGSAASGSSSW